MDSLITKSIPEEISVMRTKNAYSRTLLYYKDVTGYERCTNRAVLNSCKKEGLSSFSFLNSPTKGFKIKPFNKLNINVDMFYLSYKNTVEVEDPRGFIVNVSLLSVFNLFKHNSLDKIGEAELVYVYINTVAGSRKVFSTWYLLDTKDSQYAQIVNYRVLKNFGFKLLRFELILNKFLNLHLRKFGASHTYSIFIKPNHIFSRMNISIF